MNDYGNLVLLIPIFGALLTFLMAIDNLKKDRIMSLLTCGMSSVFIFMFLIFMDVV